MATVTGGGGRNGVEHEGRHVPYRRKAAERIVRLLHARVGEIERAGDGDEHAAGGAGERRQLQRAGDHDGRREDVGRVVDDEIERRAVPFRQPLAHAVAAGDRPVDAVDEEREAEPDEGVRPPAVGDGHDREERERRAARGQKMNGEEMSRPHFHLETTPFGAAVSAGERDPAVPHFTPASLRLVMPVRRALGKPRPRGETLRSAPAFAALPSGGAEGHLPGYGSDRLVLSMLRWSAAARPASPPRSRLQAPAAARSSSRRRPSFRPAARRRFSAARSIFSPISTYGRRLSERAAPITAIRLVDATARLIRAPEATFYASEIGSSGLRLQHPERRARRRAARARRRRRRG